MALKYAIDSILQFIIVLHPGACQYEVFFAYVIFGKNMLESIIISELWNIFSNFIPKSSLEYRFIALYHGQLNTGW